MDKTPVIEKIRKLLALADSCNEHEAALAARHAQRLLSEHNLAMADIATSGRPEQADTVETAVARNLPKWLRHLSTGISSAFDCQAVHHPTRGTMTFIGVGADVQIAVYTFTYLERTVRRLCREYLKLQGSAAAAGRQRELLRNSYYLGAVSTIIRQVQEQKRQTPVTPGALVPVKDGLVRKALDRIGPVRTMHSRRSCVDSDAYGQGQRDGRTIAVHKGLGSAGAAKRLR